MLTLVVFLGGLWVYLHKAISGLTVTEPDAPTLLLLGVMHYVVLVYLALGLIVFYAAGNSSGNPPPPDPSLALTQTFLFKTWPVTILILVVSFLAAKIGNTYRLVLDGLALAAAVSFFMLFWKREVSWGQIALFFLGIGISAIIYLMLMSVAFADVEIKTDRQFYAATDTILASARAGGYIFRPRLSRISCGIFQKDISYDVTLEIPPNQHCGDGLISVTYRPQLFSLTKTRYHQVNVVKAQ